jgi:hypothetical protein
MLTNAKSESLVLFLSKVNPDGDLNDSSYPAYPTFDVLLEELL